MKIERITFVCTGNTCRSVMAERVFKDMVRETPLAGIIIDSAGTAAMPNYAIIGDLKVVMDEEGIDYSGHAPRMISKKIVKTTDLMLTMTSSHKEQIKYMYPEYREKIFLLSEYADGNEKDILDPIGLGKDTYRKAFKEIGGYLEKLMEKLNEELEGKR